jgi:hypothetical protein
MDPARDDSLMRRFDDQGLRRFRARDAVAAVCLVGVLLVLFAGRAVRNAGEQMDPGVYRDVVLVVGKPAGWVSDQLPLADAAHDATAWLSPDQELAASGGFESAPSAGSAAGAQAPPVTAAAFDPAQIGAQPPPKRPLRTLLVTGDSLSTPLDTQLARLLAPRGIHVVREPHLGTGISKSLTVDWGRLSASQVRKQRTDAVVMFIGANEGFPMNGADGKAVQCCGADWAAIYAGRARKMMDTYRRGGASRVYWVTIPTPRDPDRQRISRVVNAAISVAAEPWKAQVRVIDSVPVFTPTGYRAAMPIDGVQTIVRRPDGIHLNDAGAALLAKLVLARIGQDYVFEPER